MEARMHARIHVAHALTDPGARTKACRRADEEGGEAEGGGKEKAPNEPRRDRPATAMETDLFKEASATGRQVSEKSIWRSVACSSSL